MQEEVVRTMSEDCHCFRPLFKHNILVATGPSVGFSKHLCLGSNTINNIHTSGHTSQLKLLTNKNFRDIKNSPPIQFQPWSTLLWIGYHTKRVERDYNYSLLRDQENYTLTKVVCFYIWTSVPVGGRAPWKITSRRTVCTRKSSSTETMATKTT